MIVVQLPSQIIRYISLAGVRLTPRPAVAYSVQQEAVTTDPQRHLPPTYQPPASTSQQPKSTKEPSAQNLDTDAPPSYESLQFK